MGFFAEFNAWLNTILMTYVGDNTARMAARLYGALHDDKVKDKVLLPGFIDPHLHPLLGAIAFQTVWITPEPWNVMGQRTPATLGQGAYLKALKTAFADRKKDAPIFMTWGFSADSHGELSGELLDGISKDVPILVLQRSMHEIYINTPMLAFLKAKGLNEDKFKDHPQIDWTKNHFWEDGMFSVALPYMAGILLNPAAADPVAVVFVRIPPAHTLILV